MKKENHMVWVDLEMTGLDPSTDTILEIATLITDETLEIVSEGPNLIIHQPDSVLDAMNSWCKEHHKKSGLTAAVQQSVITVEEAKQQTLDFIKTWCFENTASLCGNSVWQDRFFLQTYMPEINAYLHYRLIDVTAIKRLVQLWYPNNPKTFFKKNDTHRALDDIKESIEELKHYKRNFFI